MLPGSGVPAPTPALMELQPCSLRVVLTETAPVITDPVWMVTRGGRKGGRVMTAHAVRGDFTFCGMNALSYPWRSDLGDTIRCRVCSAVPEGYATSNDLFSLGLTKRQIQYWVEEGWIRALDANPGSGVPKAYPLDEVQVAATMARFVALGLTPHAASRAARNGGQLAPGVRIVIEAAGEGVDTTTCEWEDELGGSQPRVTATNLAPPPHHDPRSGTRSEMTDVKRHGGDEYSPDLVPNQEYEVKFDDCCVAGSFIDQFVGFEYSNQERDFCEALVFNHGRLTSWLTATFTPVSELERPAI